MRKGMRSSKQARHAARNVRANATRALDLLTANLRRALSALLAFAMVVTMAVALPSSASADVDASSNCSVITSDDMQSVKLTFTGTVRDDNGQSTTTTWVDPTEISGIAPNTDMSIEVNGHFKDGKVTTSNLCWQYPLPFSYDAVKDVSKTVTTAWAGTLQKATLQIVKGSDGKAYLEIKFNEDWVKTQSKDFYFDYTTQTHWDDKTTPNKKDESWEFPGSGTTIDVHWSNADVTGNKNCWYDGSVAATTENNKGGMTCEVTLNAEDQVDNFVFTDEWGPGLTVHNDFVLTTSDGKQYTNDSFTRTKNTDGSGKVELKLDHLPKGENKIRYTTEVNASANFNENSGKYDNASNTASWKFDGLNGERKDTFKPHKNGSSGGSGSGSNYTYIRKESSSQLDSDGNITWTVHVNSGSDKFNVKGYKLQDCLENGSQTYVGDLKIYRGHEASGDPVKTLDEAAFKNIQSNTIDGNKTGFEYIFNDDVFDSSDEFTIVYKTKPDTNQASYFNNRGKIFDPSGNEKENVSADFRTEATDPGSLLSKSVEDNAEQVGTNSKGQPVYKVKWTINFDPTKANGISVTDLNLYEDWVNGNSDGNTLHMWYTSDTLGLDVQEACDTGTAGCSDGWKNVTDQYTARYKNGRDLPTSDPDGDGKIDYPAGWYRKSAYESDSNTLHDGVPAFKLDNNGHDSAYTKKMRISYYTLFDGTPDEYKNYAKFSYKLAGTDKNEVVSAVYKYVQSDTNYVGKTVDAENQGSSNCSDAATWETADQITKSLVDSKQYTKEQAEKLVSEKYPQGRWRVHWRVWGNGVKSWWIDGLSGLHDLSDVDTVTMTDKLPLGWKLATDKPVYGRFVNNQLTDEDKKYGKQEHWETFRLVSDQSECTGTDGQGQAVVCGTYSALDSTTTDNGSMTFTVPNDATLTSYRAAADNPHTPTDAVKTMKKQHNSIVVFGFDTYITPADLKKLGFENGQTMVFNNTANIQFDGKNIAAADANGTTSVATKGILGKSVRQTDYDNDKYTYQLMIDNPNNYPIGDGDSFRLTDTLSNTAEYTGYQPDRFIVALINGDDQKLVADGQIGVKISENSETHEQSLTFTIPKTLKYTRYANVTMENGLPTKWDNPDSSETDEEVTNPKLMLMYTVHLKGVVGEYLQVSNSVKFTGDKNAASSTSNSMTVKASAGTVGAEGGVSIYKYDDDFAKPTLLPNAQFKICEVDTDTQISNGQIPYKDENSCQTVTTNENGAAEVTNVTQYGKLYVAIETVAPSGYKLDATPHYFAKPQPASSASKSDCGNTNCSAQYAALKDWSNRNNVQIDTSGSISVYDAPTEVTVAWNKADLSNVQYVNGKVQFGGGWLAGSKWKVEQQNCDANTISTLSSAAKLPCTFYVKDNGGSLSGGTDGVLQIADEDNADGQMAITGFERGKTYHVTEIQAPEGYQATDVTYTLTIGANGQANWGVEGKQGEIDLQKNGLYVVSGSDGKTWTVITNKKLLTTMPFTGRFGGVGMWLAMGLALGVSSFGLFMSTGKERRPRASHSRV